MQITEIIRKKRDGWRLSREEICEFVRGYTRGEIPDYQCSALLTLRRHFPLIRDFVLEEPCFF